MNIKYAIEFLHEATNSGSVEIDGGVYLNNKNYLIANDENLENLDFKRSDFWITNDNQDIPIPVKNIFDMYNHKRKF